MVDGSHRDWTSGSSSSFLTYSCVTLSNLFSFPWLNFPTCKIGLDFINFFRRQLYSASFALPSQLALIPFFQKFVVISGPVISSPNFFILMDFYLTYSFTISSVCFCFFCLFCFVCFLWEGCRGNSWGSFHYKTLSTFYIIAMFGFTQKGNEVIFNFIKTEY